MQEHGPSLYGIEILHSPIPFETSESTDAVCLYRSKAYFVIGYFDRNIKPESKMRERCLGGMKRYGCEVLRSNTSL
jgi:hypothetical protein